MLSHEFDPEPRLPLYCRCGMPEDALVHRLHVRPRGKRPSLGRLFDIVGVATVVVIGGYFLLPVLADAFQTAWGWVTNR